MFVLDFKYKVRNPYLITIIATMGGMLFGFDISSMSAFIGEEPYLKYFDHPDATRQAGITSSMPGGSLIGSIIGGSISDRLGRRPIIQLSSVVWIIGCAIQSGSAHWGMLIAGRFIAGVGIGLASSSVPVYIAELSPKNIRGRLVGVFQWAITWGIMIMFYICFGLSYMKNTASFRIGWAIQIVPGLILFFGTAFLDESPRWLAKQDRWEEAINIISHIQARGDREADQVKIEIEEIKEAVRIEHNSNVTIFTLFKGKTNLRRTMTGLWCQIWQQLTGMNVMMYYIVNVFTMAGYSGNANLVASSIQYVINVAMTVPALLWVDKWGRRSVMLAGSILLMGWLFAMAGILAVYSNPTGPDGYKGNKQVRIRIPEDQKAASKAAIAVSYLFVATFAPTWGPVAWIYCAEIFPLEQRAMANGLCAAANWMMNFAIGMFTPPAFVSITWKTYVVYATFCGAMTIHIFFMFPETHGLTLEEVDELWNSGIPAWKSTSFRPSLVPNIADINAVGGGRAPSIDKPGVEHLESSSESADKLSVELKH